MSGMADGPPQTAGRGRRRDGARTCALTPRRSSGAISRDLPFPSPIRRGCPPRPAHGVLRILTHQSELRGVSAISIVSSRGVRHGRRFLAERALLLSVARARRHPRNAMFREQFLPAWVGRDNAPAIARTGRARAALHPSRVVRAPCGPRPTAPRGAGRAGERGSHGSACGRSHDQDRGGACAPPPLRPGDPRTRGLGRRLTVGGQDLFPVGLMRMPVLMLSLLLLPFPAVSAISIASSCGLRHG